MGLFDRRAGSRAAMRVLFFDHTAELGGGEIALWNLLGHLNPAAVKPIVVLGADGPLAERLRTDFETYILPLPWSVGRRKKDSLGVATLLQIPAMFETLAYVFRLRRFIRMHRIDVVHTNSLKAHVIGGIAGRLSGRPVVWHLRDRIEDDYLPRSVVRMVRALSRLIPTSIIAVSQATLSTVRSPGVRPQAVRSKLPEVHATRRDARAVVVHDGTAIRPLRAKETNVSAPFRIGLIGRISPWKGQHVFLRAAARVLERFPNARFVIVGAPLFGEDGYNDEIRQLPTELGIADSIEFAGFREDIGRVIDELDMVVHASTVGEPFGQVIIEGMAAAKPVVATNGGGVPEIVNDGITGILVPMGDTQSLADAMCALLADPKRAREMGIQGRQRVIDHFTVTITATKVETVLGQIYSQAADGGCAADARRSTDMDRH
jgi:glycosyltransferase involved in cell wall biosynthesis